MNTSLSTTIKENVRGMVTYSVPIEFDGIKLNQNESSTDLPITLKEEILDRLIKTGWNRYPGLSADRLIKRISDYTGFPVEGIMADSGSNELIRTLIYGCCDSGGKLLTVNPTFSVYERVAEIMNIETWKIPLRPDFSFDVPALIAASGQVDIVILGNPNNPTGTMLENEDIMNIAGNTNALVVMDEAYFEFSRRSSQELIEGCPNIVVLRTFSKALRASGLRIGYLMADPGVVRELEKIRLPFSLATFQQLAGEVILEQRDWLSKSIETTLSERNRVFKELLDIPGIEPVQSQANFILFKPGRFEAAELFDRLRLQGVLVRLFTGIGSNGMLRVSIGTVEENNRFLDTIRVI